MSDNHMNTAGFTQQDHDLYAEVSNAGPLTRKIMEQVGTFGIVSQAVTREMIRAIARLENNAAAADGGPFGSGGNPEFPHSENW